MKELEHYEDLEIKFAEWNELDPTGMVACSSGTAALHLALEAMQLPLGSRVIVPDLTMVACPRAVMLAGLVPKFVDCDDRLLMKTFPLRDKENLGRMTRTVMPVHVYGRRCDMDYVSRTAKTLEWVVVEDLAEAHGIRPHEQTDAACWSFYKNKIIAGEEGGAVYFRDPEHAKLARQLRSLGFTDDHDFTHVPRGHNYRMSNCHAELVLKSLAEADENIKKRWQVEHWYATKIPREWQMPARDAVWVYDLRIPGMTSEQQDRLVRGLNAKGVAARHCFKPMTMMEEWRGQQPVSPNALRLSREVIYIPISPQTTEIEVATTVDKLLTTVSSVSSGLGH